MALANRQRCLLRLLFLFPISVSAQRPAMTFAEYRELNHGTSLDSIYRTALNVDSSKAVFHGDEEFAEVKEAWEKFMREFDIHLRKGGFRSVTDIKCMTKVYFNKDGRVDHFLYSIREGGLDRGQEELFARLLNDYVKERRFPLKAAEPYSQCGAIVFRSATAPTGSPTEQKP